MDCLRCTGGSYRQAKRVAVSRYPGENRAPVISFGLDRYRNPQSLKRLLVANDAFHRLACSFFFVAGGNVVGCFIPSTLLILMVCFFCRSVQPRTCLPSQTSTSWYVFMYIGGEVVLACGDLAYCTLACCVRGEPSWFRCLLSHTATAGF